MVSVSDNKRTDGPFSTERTVRSLIITNATVSIFLPESQNLLWQKAHIPDRSREVFLFPSGDGFANQIIIVADSADISPPQDVIFGTALFGRHSRRLDRCQKWVTALWQFWCTE